MSLLDEQQKLPPLFRFNRSSIPPLWEDIPSPGPDESGSKTVTGDVWFPSHLPPVSDCDETDINCLDRDTSDVIALHALLQHADSRARVVSQAHQSLAAASRLRFWDIYHIDLQTQLPSAGIPPDKTLRAVNRLEEQRIALTRWLMDAPRGPEEVAPFLSAGDDVEQIATQNYLHRAYIPLREHPGLNFRGAIIGVRGRDHVKLEADTGARIQLRGEGIQNNAVAARDIEPHVRITALTRESLYDANRAIQTSLHRALLPDSANEHKQAQLRQLAVANGAAAGELDDANRGLLHAIDDRSGPADDEFIAIQRPPTPPWRSRLAWHDERTIEQLLAEAPWKL